METIGSFTSPNLYVIAVRFQSLGAAKVQMVPIQGQQGGEIEQTFSFKAGPLGTRNKLLYMLLSSARGTVTWHQSKDSKIAFISKHQMAQLVF